MSSGTEFVQKALKEHSEANIDDYVRVSCFQSDEIHNAIRAHIALEWKSWAFYRKLASDAGRANICLHGFGMLFRRAAAECYADGQFLENYLVQRGSKAKPSDIPAPDIEFSDSPVDVVYPTYEALKVEKTLLEDCINLANVADKHHDPALQDLIEDRFLKKETKHVKDMGDLLQQCVRVSKDIGHGVYQLDKELRQANGTVPWGASNDPNNIDAVIAAGVLGHA